jgi:hypothetical protein
MELLLGWILLGVVLVCAIAGVLFLMGFIDLVTGAPLSVIACVSGLAVAFLIALVLFAGVSVRPERHAELDRRWVMEGPPEIQPPVVPAPPRQVVPVSVPAPRGEIDPAEPFVFDTLTHDGTQEGGIPVDPVTESSETAGSLPDWTKLTDENLEKLPLATGLFPSRADSLDQLEDATRERAVGLLASRHGSYVPRAAIPDSLVRQLIQSRHVESSHSETLGQTMYRAHGLLKFDEAALRQLDEVWRQQTVGGRLTNAGGAAVGLLGLLSIVWGGLKVTARKRAPAPAAV